MEEGPGLELRQENKGLKGFQGCDRDTLGCVHILATVNSAAVNIQFSHSVMSDFATPWTAARQASLSITNSWSLLKLMSIELVMPSTHLILCHPLLLLSPIPSPASESFPISQLFA